MNNGKSVHLSVVSHCQSRLVADLLEDVDRYCHGVAIHATVTVNVPEPLCFDPVRFRFPVHLVHNANRQGFSVNHNAAFRYSQREYPCQYLSIVNPDIRLSSDPFRELLDCLEDDRVGVVAPLVLNIEGGLEDGARRFPTPLSTLARVFGRRRDPDYPVDRGVVSPDWVAGLFMLIPTETFSQVGGFNQRYFLYYEDVDLCARLRIAGYDVRLCPSATVIHAARRQSHTDLKYLRWHIASMVRFFLSPAFFSVSSRRKLDRLRRRGCR